MTRIDMRETSPGLCDTPRLAALLPLVVVLLFCLCSPHQVSAQRVPRVQVDFYHPELEWKTIETEHFFVHYHDGAERTARVVTKIVEDIYEPVTSLYGHVPDQKVSFIIRDHDDISNGAAYFYDNKVEIYAPSMDFEFRGTHNWLRNVITHEFTHIVQMQTAMKFGRTMPAFYLQWLGYESERRPDVLYGFPNKIVSFPISGFVVPVWFAEGVAQYNRKELRYDFWDAHRDMILRSYVLDGNMLTWEQMSVFGKTSLGNESSYNAGFAFVHYIAQRFGEEKINEISRSLARLTEGTIDGAIERAVGRKGSLVYEDWKAEMMSSYAGRVAPIRQDLREGSPIIYYEEGDDLHISPGGPDEKMTLHAAGYTPAIADMQPCCRAIAETGFANLHPKFSPEGKRLAFVSTGTGDYFSQSSLYIDDLQTRIAKPVQTRVSTSLCWSPDGTKIYYGRSTRDNPHYSYQTDLYVYDVQRDEETRLTHGKRAMSPAVSPDGKRIAFVVNHDGTTNIAVMNLDGSDDKIITPYANGEQVYTPVWSPSGDRILFDYSVKDGRDIAWVKPDGSDLQFLVTGPDDSRGGTFMPVGTRILFSSDRTGIFNLYTYDLETTKIAQISNVLGGAFMPTVNAEGRIVYSAYTSKGYKLCEMVNPVEMGEGEHHYVSLPGAASIEKSGPLALASNGSVATTQFDWHSLRSYDDTQLPPLDAKPYRSKFTNLSIVPFLRIDNYNPKNKAFEVLKPGVYLFSNEILEKLSFFAGVALNTQLERDLFVQFSYRGRIPGMYQLGLEPVTSIEAYNVTRKTDNALELGNEVIPIDVTYNLTEFDFVLNQPLVPAVAEVEFRYVHSRYTSIIESFINPFDNRVVSASSDLYLISNTLSLTVRVDAVPRSRTDEINPLGREVRFNVSRDLNKFNGDGEYEISSTGLVPVYKNVNFTRVELLWKEHIPFFFKNHTLTASVKGGSILGPEVDEFFDFYAGGLIGMKGYPFYSLGGNEMAIGGLNYRFPLAHNLDIRFLPIYFDKLYASFYADIGNAWTGKIPNLRQFKTDAGVELRLESFSFYAYPTRVFLNVAYGFDQFTRLVRSRNQVVTYGKEWSVYFGVLFGFDFD